MDKIIQIAKSIQSFPSIGTLSTSSTGKYSGIGTGSVRRGKIKRYKKNKFSIFNDEDEENKKEDKKFNLIFNIII